MKTFHLTTKIFLISILMSLSLACSDDDTESPANPSNTETSSYDINIEGEGNFSQDNITADDEPDVMTSSLWFESPDIDYEIIQFTITNDSDNLVIVGTILLQDGNPAPLGSPSDYDEDDPQISQITITLDGKFYGSKSGNLNLSNLEIIPVDTGNDVNGDSGLANFTLNFTAQFDDAATAEEENIEVSGTFNIFSSL